MALSRFGFLQRKGNINFGNLYMCSTHRLNEIHVRHFPINVGYRAEKFRTFTEEDVKEFAEVSGDHNPLHSDMDYAKTTRFGQPIVHGVLQLS